MELCAEARIPFPPKIVFTACRDDIAKLLPYLPSIRSIDVVSRREEGPFVDLAVEWLAGGDVLPPIRALFGASAFSWTDYAKWDSDTLSVDWRTETKIFGDALRCEARDVFLADGSDGTLLQVSGALEVDANKISAVPSILANKVGRSLEGFLVAKVQSSITETARALAHYLGETR